MTRAPILSRLDGPDQIIPVLNALIDVVEALSDRVYAIEDVLELDGNLPPWMVDVAVNPDLL